MERKNAMKTKMLMSMLLSFLVTSLVVAEIPANDKAKENAQAPENSPVIDDDWELTRLPHYILSDVPDLKALLGVRHEFHEFPGLFSTDLTPEQVEYLDGLGIDTVPVQLYQVTAKPVCGDGIAQKSEQCGEPGLPGCPAGYVCEKCKCVEETAPPERSCYPRAQTPWGVATPWGVIRVNGGSGGAGVIVAVLDTGVYIDHLDLKANVVDCKDATGRKIRNGCSDSHGHGTHVAGTIVANGGDDGLGIVGVAPEAKLMAIKVCGKSGCWGDDIAEAIYYAADNGANIISMSLGGDSPDLLIEAAIDYAVDKGVLVVASAGNDGPEEGSIDYPAANPKVIAVGASGMFGAVPDWSSRGVNDGDYVIEEGEVEFSAPGIDVESTYKDGCYARMQGTSMAAPHVSGLAAILWRGNDADTRSYLQAIAVDIWDLGDDTATGFGVPIASGLTGLTVLRPNGGESWHRGGSYAIGWISIDGSATVDIYLLKDGSPYRQLADDIPNERVFLWDIPMDLTVDSDYRIQIYDGINTDESDADFSIVVELPSGTFDIAYDQANASKWFGGDNKDSLAGRNVGVGQSFQFNEDALLQTFGFRFQRPFDYFQNPEGAGHAVDLILHIRSEDGNIIAERETHVPATFSGGWVLFDINLTFQAGTTHIFTCYLKDGSTNMLMTGVHGWHGSDLIQNSVGYSAQNYSDRIDQWSDWHTHSWDFNIRLQGEWIDVPIAP
jgi:subtilisin